VLKGEHDAAWIDTAGDEFVSDADLGAVVLDPDVVAAQVDMNDDTVHAAPALPAAIEKLEVAARFVGDVLDLDLTLRGGEGCTLYEHRANDRAV
jgi:hypothetical protein